MIPKSYDTKVNRRRENTSRWFCAKTNIHDSVQQSMDIKHTLRLSVKNVQIHNRFKINELSYPCSYNLSLSWFIEFSFGEGEFPLIHCIKLLGMLSNTDLPADIIVDFLFLLMHSYPCSTPQKLQWTCFCQYALY